MKQTTILYHAPHSLDALFEQVEQGQQQNAPVVFYAGGTDVMLQLKQQTQHHVHVISLRHLSELTGIRFTDTHCYIGARTTLQELVTHDTLQTWFPAIAETAQQIATPQIRFRATIGGNLLVDNRCVFYNQSDKNREAHNPCFKAGGSCCHLVKSTRPGDSPLCWARTVSDLAPVFMVLDAKLALQNKQTTRWLPLVDFYRADGIQRHSLQPGELLTMIEIPLLSQSWLGYKKLRIREAIDFPSLGVAMRIHRQPKELHQLDVALSGVDTQPIHLSFTQTGEQTTDEFLQHVCQSAMRSVSPIKQDFFPPSYRKQMIAVFLRRLWSAGEKTRV